MRRCLTSWLEPNVSVKSVVRSNSGAPEINPLFDVVWSVVVVVVDGLEGRAVVAENAARCCD